MLKMKMLLSLTTETRPPGITVIKISGHIALGVEKGQIEEAVVGALKRGVQKIVIDLHEVSYIDSAGIGIIAFCFGKAGQAGAQFSISGRERQSDGCFRHHEARPGGHLLSRRRLCLRCLRRHIARKLTPCKSSRPAATN